ncbi:hypothetical protein ACE38W_09905 [Chitinophaga sp. Hz27]|uniref:hypothetical protein n=1 Tax=Chitinophaga sp. Hz27 TaxID=3347169 RepID=UPI0035DE247D
MKYLLPYLLSLALCPAIAHAQTKGKSPFKTQISNYTIIPTQAAKVEVGDGTYAFMESTSAKIGYYSITELDVIDKKAKPVMLKNLKAATDTKPILLYNGKQVTLPKAINDCAILLPTELTSFSLGSDKYLLLELDLVSLSSNNGCEYLLLKLDAKDNLLNTSDFQTAQPLTQVDLGDLDGDGILDFQIKATGKAPHAIYRSTDNKKLKG